MTVQQNTYGCANTDPSNPTCWGVLYASGIQANGPLTVNVTFSDGSKHSNTTIRALPWSRAGTCRTPPYTFHSHARTTSISVP